MDRSVVYAAVIVAVPQQPASVVCFRDFSAGPGPITFCVRVLVSSPDDSVMQCRCFSMSREYHKSRPVAAWALVRFGVQVCLCCASGVQAFRHVAPVSRNCLFASLCLGLDGPRSSMSRRSAVPVPACPGVSVIRCLVSRCFVTVSR